jgi:hypothetical protein
MQNWIVITIGIIAGSSFLAAIATNWQAARQHRKEMVAGAIKSALRRVEMYYRVRRRRSTKEDDTILRDLFHDIQEENDQYTALLDMEAPWLGEAYRNFLTALRSELQAYMSSAWAPEQSGGPGVQLITEKKPEVDHLVRRFSKDGRCLFNPVMRPLMRVRYSLRKLIKENPYAKR